METTGKKLDSLAIVSSLYIMLSSIVPVINNIVSTATSLILGIDDSVTATESGDWMVDSMVVMATGTISSKVMNESVFAAIAMEDANVHPTTKDDATCTLFSIQTGTFLDESTTGVFSKLDAFRFMNISTKLVFVVVVIDDDCDLILRVGDKLAAWKP